MPVKRKGGGGGREFDWIRWIRKLAPGAQGRAFPLTLGDDAAIWTPRAGASAVLTVDTQVEGVHFRRDWLSLREIGARSVASSVSDLAAMAAKPVGILVSLVLESSTSDGDFHALYRGIHAAAVRHGVRILGGNLSSGPLSITVTAIGEGRAEQLVRRAGARAGDEIWVTGRPGLARLGLRAFERGGLQLARSLRGAPRAALGAAMSAFAAPRARVRESLAIASQLRPSAMIDLSDGLAADLGRILDESSEARGRSLGAEIREGQLAGTDALARVAQAVGETSIGAALEGGEDYELCFTSRPAVGQERRARRLARTLGLRITQIGRVVEGKGLRLLGEDGAWKTVGERGWDHFG